MTKDEIFKKIACYLEEEFEIPRDQVVMEARLYEDLDLDSIDGVDLIVKLQEITGEKIPPEDFKAVRTISDVVDAVHKLVTK